MNIAVIFIYCLFFSFFSQASIGREKEEIVGFYVKKEIHEKNDYKIINILKLSLDEKRMKELDERMNHYYNIEMNAAGIVEKNIGIFIYTPDSSYYTNCFLVEVFSTGRTLYRGDFIKSVPFSFQYKKLNKNQEFLEGVDPRLIGYYSIEEFFTPNEKAKMIELIPEWSPENIKKREDERKKQEAKKAEKVVVKSFYVMLSRFLLKSGKYMPAKEVFKLSLDKKRTLELQDKIDHFDAIEAREIGYTLPSLSSREIFSGYDLIGKDVMGKEVKRSRLLNSVPFSLQYTTKIKSFFGVSVEVKYYSIEDFFTSEEKEKLLELIPLWRVGKEKEREKIKKLWQEAWDERAKTL